MKNKQNSKDNFYITEVVSEKQESANQSKAKINDEKQEKISSYLIKNKGKFEKATSQVLNYMVNEETHFTDLMKIEDYFKHSTIQDFKKFNQNDEEIKKKKKLLEELDLQIGQQLVNAIQCDVKQIEKLYEPEIISLEQSIQRQQHDFQSYQSTYNNIYQENFQLKKRLQENIKFSEISDKQYEKYLTIQQNAQRSYKMQKNLLRDMQNFEEMSTEKFDSQLEKKKILCHKLEYDVLTVKKEISSTQNNLDMIKLEIVEKEKQIEERNRKNEKLSLEYQYYMKDYLKMFTKIHQIYNSIKVKDLDSIITRFKEERIQYQGYNSLFYNLNLEISALNNTYSNYVEQLICIKSKIKEVHLNFSEEAIQELDIKLKFTIERIKYLTNATYEKEQYLKNLFIFLQKYDKKFTDMVNSISIYALNLTHLNLKKREEMNFKNGDKNYEKLKKAKEWGKEECREFINYFLKWQRKGCFIYSNFLMNVIVNCYSNAPLPKYSIVAFSSEGMCERVDKVINEALNQYEDKVSFQKQAQRNLFKDKSHSLEKKIKEFFFGKKATLDDIFSHYSHHIKQSGQLVEQLEEETVEGLISTLKTKFFNTISKYTNDFVQQPLKAKLTMNPVNTMNIADNLQESSSRKTIVPLVIKKAVTHNPSASNIHEEENNTKRTKVNLDIIETLHHEEKANSDDSYISQKKEKVSTGKKKKERNYFGYDKNRGEEMQQLYRRINDLNKLELDFFKAKEKKGDKAVNNQQFSEIYFNFKKKFNNKAFTPIAKNFTNKFAAKKINNTSFNGAINVGQNNINHNYSTREDTKPSYNYLNTEPAPSKNAISLNKSKKAKKNFIKELIRDDYLLDNEKVINTHLEKNKNLLMKSRSSARDIGFFNFKQSPNKDDLPSVFNSTNGFNNYTKHYANKIKYNNK